VRHFNEPGHVHELTFSCYLRQPLLTRDAWRTLLSRGIAAATEKLGFDLLAFVYMPEHVHLLVCPRSATAAVERFLYAVKRPFSFRVKRDLMAASDPLLNKLTVIERPGKQAFRFWQEGAGFDRNLTEPEAVLAVIDYMHANPVKRGLCESPDQWPWSSWGHYHAPDRAPPAGLPLVCRFSG
jgi:putative transposase